MRSTRLALLALIAVLASAGCGAVEEVDRGASLADAAANTTSVGSVHLSMTVAMGIGNSPPVEMSTKGEMDLDQKRGKMKVDLSAIGAQAGGSPSDWIGEEIIDFGDGVVAYVNVPFYKSAFETNKDWIKMDLGKILEEEGIDLNQFTQAGSGDPTEMLRYMQARTDDVEVVGEDDVRGVATTHYRAVLDLLAYPETFPEGAERDKARKSIEKLTELGGTTTIPTDVWVDEDDLVRKMRYQITQKIPESNESMQIDTTIWYYDFGAPVDIQIPSDDESFDLFEFIKKEGSV